MILGTHFRVVGDANVPEEELDAFQHMKESFATMLATCQGQEK